MAPVADPSAPLRDAESLIENGRMVPIGYCTRWIRQTFQLFLQNPWKWIGTVLLLIVLALSLSAIPYSTIVTTILYPVMIGGIACALDAQRRTRQFTLRDIFSGFGPAFLSLATVGCVALLSSFIMFAVLYAMVGTDAALGIAFNASKMETMPPNFWSAMIVSTVATLPVTAATFLAAPLVILHGARPMQAMKMSFFACVKNIVPWVLFGILMFLIIMLSALPLLLGLFVTVPAALLTFYPIYRDVFIAEEIASP